VLAQRLALYELGRDELQSARFADLVDRYYVRVI
jgi:hypothetical protein